MSLHPLLPLVLAWAACGAACAAPGASAADEACRLPARPVTPWGDREGAIRDLGRQTSFACLASQVRQCSDAASRVVLDGDAAADCSVRYEALLRHRFGGDFQALLAWWRGQRPAR